MTDPAPPTAAPTACIAPTAAAAPAGTAAPAEAAASGTGPGPDSDEDLLDRIRALTSGLDQRTVLLTLVRSNVDIYAEGLRDLGHDLADLGTDLLARVAELDGAPISTTPAPDRLARYGDLLARLTLRD